MKYDYLIVGCGLAGMAFSFLALEKAKRILVVDHGNGSASKVAAGIYNPVVLKRMKKVWNAKQLLETSGSFYKRLQKFLQIEVFHPTPILRSIFSAEEQNNWYQAADKASLAEFVQADIVKDPLPGIRNTYGYGKLKVGGRLNTIELIDRFRQYLADRDMLSDEVFNHEELSPTDDGYSWNGLRFKKVVFAEGYAMSENPYFNHLPMVGNKGEYIKVYSEKLSEDIIVKAGIFIVPLGNHEFLAGATYNRTDLDLLPSESAREEIIKKLDAVLEADYRVLEQTAGIRPTVPDRKPLVGEHHDHKGMYILNGMGSRGVLQSPFCATSLFNLTEQGLPLDPHIDISRFA